MENETPKPYKATAKEVADHFSVARRTIYNWMAADDPLPHRKIGGVLRFNMAEVDEWARRQGEES